MSEHDETAKRITQAWGPQTTLGDSRRAIAAELAAAEERGRRRGLEEALEQAADIADSYGCDYAARSIRALAPRDSVPDGEVFSRDECPFNYCDQEPPFTACVERCRHRAPRDSGKVEP